MKWNSCFLRCRDVRRIVHPTVPPTPNICDRDRSFSIKETGEVVFIHEQSITSAYLSRNVVGRPVVSLASFEVERITLSFDGTEPTHVGLLRVLHDSMEIFCPLCQTKDDLSSLGGRR